MLHFDVSRFTITQMQDRPDRHWSISVVHNPIIATRDGTRGEREEVKNSLNFKGV